MPAKRIDRLTPPEVKKMRLKTFERRFGFRPVDALEKYFFAVTAERLTPYWRAVLEAGVIGPIDLTNVVMED